MDLVLTGSVSPEEAFPPSCSSDTALNPSSALPGMIHQVIVAASNAHEGGQLIDHMACNIPERGQAIAGNSREGGLAIDQGRGLTSTVGLPDFPYSLSCILARPAEYSQRQHSALPSHPSSGELALQEVPPYPCFEHHSPPSPSAASFQCAPSSELLDRSHPWSSKGPTCR